MERPAAVALGRPGTHLRVEDAAKGDRHMDDNAAVRLCQDGRSDAFRLIVERHSGVLFGTAYLMTRDRARAEDMVQEALLLAWRGIRSFKPGKHGNPGSGLRPWLIRILVNRVISEGRRHRIGETELGPDTPEPSTDAEGEDQVMRAEERELMGAAMSRLPDEQRRALTLRYYADLTVPEIARVLGWAEGTVKSRIHRGLRRLEDVLRPLSPEVSGVPAPAINPASTSGSATSMRDEQ